MAANPLIAFRASPGIKAGLHSLAQQRNLSDSAFLQRLVELALVQNAGITDAQLVASVEPVARGARLYVRLRPEDHVLLRERAVGRGIANGFVHIVEVHLKCRLLSKRGFRLS
jgi:hypothetical protein